jgi:hypothetical protein
MCKKEVRKGWSAGHRWGIVALTPGPGLADVS